MKIGILSREATNYSTTRLKAVAEERGHTVKVLDTLGFAIEVEPGKPALWYRGKALGHYDAIIPRIGASITFYGTAVLRQFEQMGVFTLNSSHAITVSRDKLRSIQILSRHQLGMPHTAFVRDKRHVMQAIEAVGGAPVIIKVLEGTQGVGVILADTAGTAQAIVETLQMAKQNVLIQKFVAESRGRDVRAFVVGNRVIGAMRRVAQGDEFRSNVHRGGKAEQLTLAPEYERTAIRAAQILGLRVAGVDMLEGTDGPMVMEVNSSPGLEGIEGATGLDIADVIIEHLEEQVLFPDVDLRQRLTLRAGYGVAEFSVTGKNNLAGKTLQDTDLKEREVHVLSVNRQGVTLPNPGGATQILDGDKLLCYGKLITLKTLISPPRPVRRKSRNRGAADTAKS